MKINIFWGELTDNSAKKEALHMAIGNSENYPGIESYWCQLRYTPKAFVLSKFTCSLRELSISSKRWRCDVLDGWNMVGILEGHVPPWFT